MVDLWGVGMLGEFEVLGEGIYILGFVGLVILDWIYFFWIVSEVFGFFIERYNLIF